MRVVACNASSGTPVAVVKLNNEHWELFIGRGGTWQIGFGVHTNILYELMNDKYVPWYITQSQPKLLAELVLLEDTTVNMLLIEDPLLDQLEKAENDKGMDRYLYMVLRQFCRSLGITDA